MTDREYLQCTNIINKGIVSNTDLAFLSSHLEVEDLGEYPAVIGEAKQHRVHINKHGFRYVYTSESEVVSL